MEGNVYKTEQMLLKPRFKKRLPPIITNIHPTISASSTYDKVESGQILLFYQEFSQSACSDRMISASARSETHGITESYGLNYNSRPIDTLKSPFGLGIHEDMTSVECPDTECCPNVNGETEIPGFLWHPADTRSDSTESSEEDDGSASGSAHGAYESERNQCVRGRRTGRSIKLHANQHKGFQSPRSQMYHDDAIQLTPSLNYVSAIPMDPYPRANQSYVHQGRQVDQFAPKQARKPKISHIRENKRLRANRGPPREEEDDQYDSGFSNRNSGSNIPQSYRFRSQPKCCNAKRYTTSARSRSVTPGENDLNMHINLRLSMDRFPFDCPLQIGERLGHEGAFSGNSHKRHAVPFSETGTGAGSCCTHGGNHTTVSRDFTSQALVLLSLTASFLIGFIVHDVTRR